MSDGKSLRKISQGMMVGSSGIICSRITGLIRDIVFARFWGTGTALGAFVLAFTIPNMFRRLFGEGALSEAFIPLFNEKLTKEGKAKAFLLLSQVLSVVTIVLAGICAVGIAVCVLCRQWLPDGLARLSADMLPILLPYLVFICLAGFLAGVLNSLGHFAVPAYAPLLLNVCMIAGTIWLCPHLGDSPEAQAKGLAWAVLVAGVLQFAAVIPVLLKFGYRFRFLPQFRSESVRELIRLLVPGMIGAGVYQVNLMCDRFLAGWLGAYAVTSLYYSERLIFLPIGVFAVALSAACLPVMSRAFAQDKPDEMVEALFYSLRHVLFLSLPCVVGLMLLGNRVINLIFRHGQFSDASFVATFGTLLFYAPGIPAFAALKIIRGGFYSRKDMKTPVKVSVFCMVLNLILNLILMQFLQQRGLALATSISAYLNGMILIVLLHRALKPRKSHMKKFLGAVARQALALLAAGLAMYFTQFEFNVRPRLVGLASELLVPAFSGMAAYFSVAFILRCPELGELLTALRRRSAPADEQTGTPEGD